VTPPSALARVGTVTVTPTADRRPIAASPSLQERLDRDFADAKAIARVDSGLVDCSFRIVEARASRSFRPTADTLPRKTAPQGFVAQYLAAAGKAPTSGPERSFERMIDPDADVVTRGFQQQAAAFRQYNEAANWVGVDFEVQTAASGELVSIRALARPPSRAFVALAEAALREALAASPLRDAAGATRSRWRFEASTAYLPPSPAALPINDLPALIAEAVRDGPKQALKDMPVPFKRRVEARVHLVAIAPLQTGP
jgi:hypothetical protein